MDTDDRRKTAVSVKVNAAKPILLGSSEPGALSDWKGSGTTFVFSMLCTGWGNSVRMQEATFRSTWEPNNEIEDVMSSFTGYL